MEYSSKVKILWLKKKKKILWLNLLEKYKIKSYRIILCSQFSNGSNFLYNTDFMTFTFSLFIFWKLQLSHFYKDKKIADGNNIEQW